MGIIYAENGTVLRSFVGKNQLSTDDRHLFQAELTQIGDSQTVESRQHAGFRSKPPAGAKLFVTKFSDHYKIAIAEDDGIIQQISEGDSIAYGQSGGSVVCSIWFKNDGSIDIEAPANVNVTAPIINVTGDVIADSGGTQISVLNHLHTDNTGGTTTPPTMTPSAPSVPYATHIHSQGNDGNGDAEVDTGVPHT